MHYFVNPFFTDFPYIATDIVYMPFVNSKNSIPAITNSGNLVREGSCIFWTEYIPTVVKTDIFQMFLIRYAVFFIFRNVNAIEDIIPLSFIEIDDLRFGNIENVDHCPLDRSQTVLVAGRAPYRCINIIRFGHDGGSSLGKPGIALHIMICHVAEMHTDIQAAIDNSTVAFEFAQRFVILTGI